MTQKSVHAHPDNKIDIPDIEEHPSGEGVQQSLFDWATGAAGKASQVANKAVGVAGRFLQDKRKDAERLLADKPEQVVVNELEDWHAAYVLHSYYSHRVGLLQVRATIAQGLGNKDEMVLIASEAKELQEKLAASEAGYFSWSMPVLENKDDG